MSPEQVRLEILKLTYTHARSAEEAVGRAEFLEAYVFETKLPSQKVEDTTEDRKPGSPVGNKKKTGNLSSLL